MAGIIRRHKTIFGGSMFNLDEIDEEPELSPPSLRRVKTSKPVRKTSRAKEPLRAVRSDPPPGTCCSPATELASRRGVFSRRHYGSVELLISCDAGGAIQNAGRFRVEDGEIRDEVHIPNAGTGTDIHLENPEYQTRWYFKYFLGKLHQNYVGADLEKNAFFLSVVLTDANNHNVPQYRAILWRKTGTQKICIPYNPTKPLTVKSILSRFEMKTEKAPKEIYNPEIQKELLLLEEQEGSVNFKFGVLYAREGQTSDDEMFSNEHGDNAFLKFVSLLGDRISLKGWDRFNAGLDVKSNTTGTKSIYTIYEGHEIMFHVSTMLPYSKDNKQQVERKRHIGNDIVTIVFQETSDSNVQPTFKPSMIKSHFTHIFALVTYNSEDDSYKLSVFSEESVPLFGPPLPSPPVFKDHIQFRDFLLVKLINGEKAAFNTPTFANKRQRTLDMLIKNLHQELLPEVSKQNMLNKRSFSDVIPEAQRGGKSRKEEQRQSEFLRIGQMLKLQTIVKGDAPTSLATTSLFRREPWEPHCITSDFPHHIVCGDTWGDRLVVGTDVGVYILEEGISARLIFDKSVHVKQLSVVEAHGLVLFRADKGKDCKVYVFRLSDFEGEQNEYVLRTKTDCKDHKLERTRGCHLYSLSRPGGSHLRMCVAIGKKLLLMTWKHSAAWTAWCTAADTDTIEGFQYVRELYAGDVPILMTLIDGGKGDNQICVGYRHQFDLINEKNGDTFRLHQVETSKVNLVTALDIYEDDEAELLLCYSHVSQFKKLTGDQSSDFDIHWNSPPTAVVCAFPYILAFTPDTIEIRLVVNGNLVNEMTMPRLSLITSKSDLYFTTCAGETGNSSGKENGQSRPLSPLGSPTSSGPPSPQAIQVFKIPLNCLVGQMTERPIPAPSKPQPPNIITPIVNIPDNGVRRYVQMDERMTSPRLGRHPPLERGKRIHYRGANDPLTINDARAELFGTAPPRSKTNSPPPVWMERDSRSDLFTSAKTRSSYDTLLDPVDPRAELFGSNVGSRQNSTQSEPDHHNTGFRFGHRNRVPERTGSTNSEPDARTELLRKSPAKGLMGRVGSTPADLCNPRSELLGLHSSSTSERASSASHSMSSLSSSPFRLSSSVDDEEDIDLK
ncbi:GTPase-activating Rap/Ran-GAP domain-like protein 3 [Saccoglossus kowalevskii]|uniref:GTPase-activating Rap/Ran-GAP domain-like protein 3-like n=1 Tax=Saccoglossus kowalevskii TaxID=10224 RepID=A0ABM0MFJ0_SACKO|nr:PREDICTED: GTPase-activating Rap/Ran-GAP domain-like protein 3-like [Saccoglossus kowalevskii]